MVRMVAMTASLLMSSQVGATAVRKMSAASANSKPEQYPSGEAEPDLASFDPRRLAGCDRPEQGGDRLQRAKGDDEHRAAFDGKSDVACDQIELLLERRVQAPQAPTPIWRRPPRHIVKRAAYGPQGGRHGLTTSKARKRSTGAPAPGQRSMST
jgi:hypothetical protein